jgi:hypothetical protein
MKKIASVRLLGRTKSLEGARRRLGTFLIVGTLSGSAGASECETPLQSLANSIHPAIWSVATGCTGLMRWRSEDVVCRQGKEALSVRRRDPGEFLNRDSEDVC